VTKFFSLNIYLFFYRIGQKVYFTSLSKRLNPKLLLKNPDLQVSTVFVLLPSFSNEFLNFTRILLLTGLGLSDDG